MALQKPLISPVLQGRWTWWTWWTCLREQLSGASSPIPIYRSRTQLRDSHSAHVITPEGFRSSRAYHTTRVLFQEEFDHNQQAVPLGDFYTELLSTPILKQHRVEKSLPTFVQSGDQSKEERAEKLFGTIEGSGYQRRTSDSPDATWRTINGVPVPPRPAEPDNCCMSGCVHCVWDDYRDDVEAWAARVHEAQSHSPSRIADDPKIRFPRSKVHEVSSSMDDDGGGSETLWTRPPATANEEDLLFQGIPIGIREFMATEKRIRDRKRARKEKSR